MGSSASGPAQCLLQLSQARVGNRYMKAEVMGPFFAPATLAAARQCPGMPAPQSREHHAVADAPGRDGRGWCQEPGMCQGRQSLPQEQRNTDVPWNTRASGHPPAPATTLRAASVTAEVGTSPWSAAHEVTSRALPRCPRKCSQPCRDGCTGISKCHCSIRCVLPHRLAPLATRAKPPCWQVTPVPGWWQPRDAGTGDPSKVVPLL